MDLISVAVLLAATRYHQRREIVAASTIVYDPLLGSESLTIAAIDRLVQAQFLRKTGIGEYEMTPAGETRLRDSLQALTAIQKGIWT